MKVVLLVQATRAEKGIGAVSKLHQKFVECSLVHKFCTIFPPTHSFCSGDAFFTKMGDEQWLRGVTKTGGLPPDKLWNWQHMLAFGQLTIPIVALSIMYCTVIPQCRMLTFMNYSARQHVDCLCSQHCWLAKQEMFECVWGFGRRDTDQLGLSARLFACTAVHNHTSHSNQHDFTLCWMSTMPPPPPAPPLCHTRGM